MRWNRGLGSLGESEMENETKPIVAVASVVREVAGVDLPTNVRPYLAPLTGADRLLLEVASWLEIRHNPERLAARVEC
jgi:hypothetical protein